MDGICREKAWSENTPKNLSEGKSKGRRRRERPKQSWINGIEGILED